MKASATPRTQLATHESRAPAPPFFAEPRSALPPRTPPRQKMPGLVAGFDGKPSLAPAFRLTMWQELRISPGRQRSPWDTRRGETRISVKTRHETWLRPPSSTTRLRPSSTRFGFSHPNATHPLRAAGSGQALSPRRPYPVTSSNPPMHRMSTYVNFKNLSWLIRFCSLLPKTVATTANGMQSATTCSTSPV